MMPTRNGSFRIFTAGGVTVFLHWSWFLIAVFLIQQPLTKYQSRVWHVVEYLSLFAIVLMHEFGHALACRQVGGQANEIVLWPLGGVAYVNPPQRAGATLWSIVAGPLVNVVILLVLIPVRIGVAATGLWDPESDFRMWLVNLSLMNALILGFNLLPIYPLDGGQILRSLLWFVLGRGKSLVVATILGFLGLALFLPLAIYVGSVWFVILGAFMMLNCWRGLRIALIMIKLERMPRHTGYACPQCHEAPQAGPFWVCGYCQTAVDLFRTGATCPRCGVVFEKIRCLNCGADHPIAAWVVEPTEVFTAELVPSDPRL